MKTIEFGPYLLLTLKPFRTVTLTVCAWWSTGYKESNTGGLLGLQPGDNNRILGLLLLKLITQTILRFTMRRIGTHYNLHRKARLILLQRPVAPRSGFAHRV